MPTTYYVSPSGSDSLNNGLGPDASAVTNRPFATWAKAFGPSGVAVPGDTVYIAPGVYRAAQSASQSGSSGNPINVLGDPINARGFRDGSGNLLAPGLVRTTTYTSSDTTAAAGAYALAMGGASYINFDRIWFVGGTPGAGGSGSINIINGSHDLNFTRCMFSHGLYLSTGYFLVNLANSGSQLPLNITFDRCIFSSFTVNLLNIFLTKTSSGGSDYDSNILIQNCLFNGGYNPIMIQSSGSGTYLGGGIRIKNITSTLSYNPSVFVNDAGISTTIPVYIYNSILFRGMSAFAAGQIIEDYNWTGARSGTITAGSNSIADGSHCLLLDFGQSLLMGFDGQPVGCPIQGAPQLGFGSGGSPPSYDFLDRPRPEGGNSLSLAIGYLERHDTAVQETSVVDSGSAIRIDGPGSQEFLFPVDTASTTISIKCRYDTNHGTSTPPQLQLVGEDDLGVSSQTITAPATTGTWHVMTFSAFTPSARGTVRVRAVTRPSAANGKAYFDTVIVT